MKTFLGQGFEFVVGIGFLLASNGLAATVTVSIGEDMKYSPSPLTIQPGDTVEFVNNSTRPHSVTADPSLVKNPANVMLPEGVAPFDSGLFKPGEKFEHTFDVPGAYRYFCTKHEVMGMVGEITVSENEISN